MASNTYNLNTYKATLLAKQPTITVGNTGKTFNGTVNVSWSKAEIIGSGTTAQFLRGDHTWTNQLANYIFNTTDIAEEAANLSTQATAHKMTFYRNGITIPYQMDNANDGGMLRVRGTAESNCILELGTWDDSGAGETIQFNYYPTTSQVTPTYSVSVPKHSGTLVTTDGHGATGTWGISITGNAATATKATQDGSGNVITSKYVTVDTAQTITGTKSWGTSGQGGYLNGSAYNGGINSILIGDDVWLGDCNQGGILGMKSTGANCGFYFYNSSGTNIGQLYARGGSGDIYSNKPLLAPSTGSSWIDGQRYERGGFNLTDATDTGSYWPWMRQTNTGSAKWFSIGVLDRSLYVIGSATSRTANGMDYEWRFDMSNGYLYGNFSGSLSGNAATATKARYVEADNDAQNPGGALCRSGAGRADNSTTGDTWIFWDSIGGTASPWGIRHDQGANTISFIGGGTVGAYITLNTGASKFGTISSGAITSSSTVSCTWIDCTRTSDHGIRVGTIRGRAYNNGTNQTGDYIQMYERVHIGSPNGWGSRNAPAYGLSTYGGCQLATDTGVVRIYGGTALDNTAFKNILILHANQSNESSGEAFSTSNSSWGISFHRDWNTSGIGSDAEAGIYAVGSTGWRTGLAFRTKSVQSQGSAHNVTALWLSPAGRVGITDTSPDACLTISGPATDCVGAIHIRDTRTDTGWHYPILATNANLPNGSNMYICIGKAATTYQSAGLRYYYNTTSTSCLMGFEFWGQGTPFYVYPNGDAYATRVYNAVWNDIAEVRNTAAEAGYVVTETKEGIMIKTTERMQAGSKIVSDTYGYCMGKIDKDHKPVAIAGRVLVYTYQDRENYELGAAVCSAPGGTVDMMTREEIMMYPERIVGTVSEMPDYEYYNVNQMRPDSDSERGGGVQYLSKDASGYTSSNEWLLCYLAA